MHFLVLSRNTRLWGNFSLFPLFLFILWGVLPFNSYCEEVVLHHFSAEHPDRRLEDILYLTAGVELTQAGLSSTRKADAPDYILLTEYAALSGELKVRYTLTSAEATEPDPAVMELDLPVDHTLDARISEAVRQLLKTAGINAAPSAEAEIEGLLPELSIRSTVAEPEAAEPEAAEPEAVELEAVELEAVELEAVELEAVELESAELEAVELEAVELEAGTGENAGGSAAADSAGDGDDAAEAREAPPSGMALEKGQEAASSVSGNSGIPSGGELWEDEVMSEGQPVNFESSFSTAGVVLFGGITEYFHYGAAGALTAGILWPRPSWSITLGSRFSLIRVFNDNGVQGGTLYLSTAGAALQFGTGTAAPYRVSADFSAGAAMITVAGSERTLTKTVPYAEVGVQTSIPVSASLSLGGGLRFLAVFDTELLITAASPALVLRMEF